MNEGENKSIKIRECNRMDELTNEWRIDDDCEVKRHK